MGRMGKVDPNSYAEPEKVVLQHADLDWEIDFNRKVISGSVTLKFKILAEEGVEQIVSSLRVGWSWRDVGVTIVNFSF